MAWTSGDFDGRLTARAAVAFVFGEEYTERHLLDLARDGEIVYAALRSEDLQEAWGLVLVIKREGKRLHVKRISEDMGPYDDRCPKRILDLLSEPSNEWARDWRRRCLARAAESRAEP
ncbi:MAG: hypothetical protein JSS68_11200 [Actinobacteria bacterium]|nr:hypothetical protein [Actinomycetota bacterium]